MKTNWRRQTGRDRDRYTGRLRQGEKGSGRHREKEDSQTYRQTDNEELGSSVRSISDEHWGKFSWYRCSLSLTLTEEGK